jgi:hypothetical protein
MNAVATLRIRIVKHISRWSEPGHGHARPDSYPSALSTAPTPPKTIVIVAQASQRHTSARRHLTPTLSRPASTVNTAIKSP